MKSLTMQQLLQNPSGPYSSYFARRDLTITNLNERFMKMVKDKKEFKLEVFKEAKNFYFYFKIPSEKYDKLFYDVVIEFIPVTAQSASDLTFNNYCVNLFSNSPNFLFTYAYVYNKDGILVNFLKQKVSDIALTQPPKIKNSIQSYGFEKSVYFALLYLKYNRLNIKSSIVGLNPKPLDTKKLIKVIADTDTKLKEYNRIKKAEKPKSTSKKVKKIVAKNPKKSYNEEVEISDGMESPKGMGRKINKKRNMSHSMSLHPKK